MDGDLVALGATKFMPPRIPYGLVPRPRLLDQLDRGVRGPLTLLAAPAGAGKSALLCSWVSDLESARVAWLSLDAVDADRRRFWRGVLEALRRAGAGTAVDALALPSAESADPVIAALVNALESVEVPLVLVLDDLHEIGDSPALGDLDQLLRRPPPALRVVVATRVDPPLRIGRMRLDGGLTELRAADLAFTLPEADALLRATRVDVTADVVELLWRRTEGWAAGLRLAAQAMRSHPDPARFVSEFAGVDSTVADYLLGEVLAQQPAELREFLLRISIVDVVNGELADALTDRTDSARVLARLERDHALLSSTGVAEAWHRLHPLFAELLRSELRYGAPLEVPGLHRRAARWFERRDRPVEALRHAAAAEDWGHVGALAGAQWVPLLLEGELQSLHEVLDRLPVALREADPELALAVAGTCVDAGDEAGAGGGWTSHGRNATGCPRCGAGASTWPSHWSAYARTAPWRHRHRDAARADAVRGQRLRRGRDLRDGGASRARSHATGDGPALERRAGPRPSPPRDGARRRAGIGARLAAHAVARLPRSRSDDERSLRPGHPAVRGGRRARTAPRLEPYVAARAHGMHAERGRVPSQPVRRRRGTSPARVRARPRRQRSAAARDRRPPARAHPAPRSNAEAAFEAVQEAREWLRDWPIMPAIAGFVEAVEATAIAAFGDPARAALTLENGAAGETQDAALALALLRLREGHADAAVQVLGPFLDHAPSPFESARTDAWVIAALAHDELADHPSAADALERALDGAEPSGMRRPFLAHGAAIAPLLRRQLRSGTSHRALVEDLLGEVERPAGSRNVAVLPESLSQREAAVLRFLPTMMSNQEIASEMFVSVNTVKTHLKSIYRKLDVDDRRAAVRRGRDLQLLGPQ